MNRLFANPRRAFTLIEGIIAIVILSLAVPPMLWTVRAAQGVRTEPLQASRARWLASEKLEDIIADSASPTRGYTFVAAANYPAERAVPGFTTFSRSVVINETGIDLVSPGVGCKTATVTVTWRSPRGTRSLALATVITNPNP